QTSTGEVYQLTFEEYDNLLMPNGNTLLTGSTTVPRNLNTKDLTIHFGEQLNDEAIIYVDPVYIVHNNIPSINTYLMEMVTLNDKKFWIWSLNKTWIKSNGSHTDGINFEFDY